MRAWGFIIYMLAILLTSCTVYNIPSADVLQEISIGIKKDEVIEKIGGPRVVRGSIMNKYGQVIEVWEYRLVLPSEDSVGQKIGKAAATVMTFGAGAVLYQRPKKDYWFYFIGNELVQWGEAGDWQVESGRIYEIRLGPEPSLTK